MVRAVAEKGYGAATVADITARSHISRRTLYDHFSDEECFLGAYEFASRATLQEIETATSVVPSTDWRGRLHLGLRTYVEVPAEDPALARVDADRRSRCGPRAVAMREGILQHYTDFYRRLAARACQTGATSPVPEVFLRGLVGAIAEIVQHEILCGRVRQLPEPVPKLAELALTVLGEGARPEPHGPPLEPPSQSNAN